MVKTIDFGVIMKKLIVKGGRPLFGSVTAAGSKNASLPILFSSLITKDVSRIDNIPEIGDTITAKINNLGKCYVLGYLLQDEWISIIVNPLNPPKWFIKQNGKSALVTLFGAEIG